MFKPLLNKSKPPALHGLVHCGGDGGLEREWLYKYSHATKKNEPLLICPSTPYCFLLKDLASFFSEVTDPIHRSPLPLGFLQALKHLGQLNGTVNLNVKQGSDGEKREEVRISDYCVFDCLRGRRDGSFIFFIFCARADSYEFGLMFARRRPLSGFHWSQVFCVSVCICV